MEGAAMLAARAPARYTDPKFPIHDREWERRGDPPYVAQGETGDGRDDADHRKWVSAPSPPRQPSLPAGPGHGMAASGGEAGGLGLEMLEQVGARRRRAG